MNMKLLEVRVLHVILIFIIISVNNVVLTSPQRLKPKNPPNFRSVPETSFSCLGRTAGYYADPEAECQAYHMCDTLEKQYSYLCPSYTLFNQKYMVCDHWHSVNCSVAVHYYVLNEEIGKVPDKENNSDNVINDQKSEIATKLRQKNEIKSTSHAHSSLKSGIVDNQSTHKDLNFQPSLSSRATTQAPTTSVLPSQFRQLEPKFERTVDSKSTQKDSEPNVRSPLLSKTSTQKPFTSTLPSQFRQPQRNFHLPKTFNESFLLSTNLQTPQKNFQSRTVIDQTTKSPNLSTIGPIHFPPTTPRTKFFSHSLHDNKAFPVNPRGSGKRIKFDQISENDLHSQVLNRFHPLFEKSKNPFIDKRNFTVPPNIFFSTPATTLDNDDDDDDDDDDDFDYDEENELQARNSPGEPIIAFLIPPTIESLEDRPFQRLNIPSLTTVLVPPPEGPVILESDHQEIRTPLVVSKIFKSFGIIPPQSEITPPRFSFTKPNREFFIPPPGLQPPINDNDNSISEEKNIHDEHFVKHKMTMTFPNRTTIRRRPLKINPRCPRCHPAFLKPNQCQPCVIIK